ncbi:GroES-like protein [Dichomitus squalens LYAD-421 SS1]|uniref:GroES-like protein n=1 Tax=Dichomitus squalens (strain LYAD-421) TaxID=732165 RepID=UPI00044146C4|nr:GroES-like protein [Dichomitus squalens LYAD-421 SS1]EJF64050.1 GroES-like protein [Dichomitus squalens LYAD-421 SS1]
MPTPTQQKALFLLEKQGQFAVRDRNVPTPNRGELLIKNESVGLNPIDWKIQQYGMFLDTYPAIIGAEGAGTIEAVGEGVTEFKKGDQVLYKAVPVINNRAAYQQYTLTDPTSVVKLGEGISLDAAATLPTALVTASVGLYSQPGGGQYVPPWAEGGKGKYASQPLVIIGGATVVGSAAIQLGKLSGFSPIVTTASLKNAALLRSYGATHVLDRNLSADALRAEVKKIIGGSPSFVYDAVSLPETQAAAYGLLAPGGRLLVILPETVKETTESRTVTTMSAGVRLQQDPQFGVDLFKVIPILLRSGEIKPLNVEVIPGGLVGIVSGLEKLKNNQVSAAKLIVHPQETA